MKHLEERIVEQKEMLRKKLEEEQSLYGGYESWYDSLAEFREQMKKYVQMVETPSGEIVYRDKITKVGTHLIDWHARAFLAPLEFKRIGIGLEKLSPEEQLLKISNQCKEKGIRFIYVPLPNKKAIYPELVVDEKYIENGKCLIPQWRRFLSELAKDDYIEIIDVYQDFVENKESDLFSNVEHNISPKGAELVGKKIAEYLQDTTQIEKQEIQITSKSMRIPVNSAEFDVKNPDFGRHVFYPAEQVYIQNNGEWEIYTGTNVSSDILLIGDCNVQEFTLQGASVTAQVSNGLDYPIEYGGRCLPYHNIDRINKIKRHSLVGKDVLIYVAFVSASFVRASEHWQTWSVDGIYENAFE